MPPERQPLPDDFAKFPHAFPTRENCDPNNPYQAYLWALIALPYQKGAPWAMPVDYMQFVSKRLWECFGPPSPDWVPSIKYQKPSNVDPNWMTAPGMWVPAGTPDRDERRPVEVAVDSLINTQQAELVRELWARMTPEQRRMLQESGDDVT